MGNVPSNWMSGRSTRNARLGTTPLQQSVRPGGHRHTISGLGMIGNIGPGERSTACLRLLELIVLTWQRSADDMEQGDVEAEQIAKRSHGKDTRGAGATH